MQVLFVPCLSLDVSLLERLAASIDYPIKFKVAYNNGPEGALDGFRDRYPDWIVKDSPTGNCGVSGAWNECAKWFSSEPNWLLMNEDAWFLPGYLEKICACMDANPTAPVVHLNDSNAFYCWGWSLAGRELVGEFDANLYPAYYEDCDYRVRMRLLGITEHPYALQGLPPLPHGKPRTGGIDYTAMLQGAGLLNRAYWLKKWGSMDFEKATYQTPYRDHRLTPRDWAWYPQHRAAIYPLWSTFINAPSPSIYD